MPTTKKANSTPVVKPTKVTNRNAAIRQSKLNQATPDSRDQVWVTAAAAVQSAPPAPTNHSLDISRAPERGHALELSKQLSSIVITDKASYQQAKQLYGVGKEVRRKITEHWQRITRSVDALKQTMFNYRDDDLSALEPGMATAEKIILAFEDAENARVRAEEDRQREERERQAKADRQRELDAAEDRALELEQQAEGLSARELWFVTKVVERELPLANATPTQLKAMLAIATEAGYKDADTQVARLLRSQKIVDAVLGKYNAQQIRQQADARRQQPVDIVDAPPVESAIAKGRGLPPTKTYYSCEVVDVNKLREAFLNNEVPAEALIPNETYLNSQARSAKSSDIFERAFPGCRLVKRKSI